jgi:hypothetical protein
VVEISFSKLSSDVIGVKSLAEVKVKNSSPAPNLLLTSDWIKLATRRKGQTRSKDSYCSKRCGIRGRL